MSKAGDPWPRMRITQFLPDTEGEIMAITTRYIVNHWRVLPMIETIGTGDLETVLKLVFLVMLIASRVSRDVWNLNRLALDSSMLDIPTLCRRTLFLTTELLVVGPDRSCSHISPAFPSQLLRTHGPTTVQDTTHAALCHQSGSHRRHLRSTTGLEARTILSTKDLGLQCLGLQMVPSILRADHIMLRVVSPVLPTVHSARKGTT